MRAHRFKRASLDTFTGLNQMTTLNHTGRAVQDVLSVAFWAAGQAAHYSVNGYHAGRRFYRGQIASGQLRRDVLALVDDAQRDLDLLIDECDRCLDEWQAFSDSLRGLLGAVLLVVGMCAFELGLVVARAAGAVYRLYRASTSEDAQAVYLQQQAAACSGFVVALWTLQRWGVAFVGGCDRVGEFAFCLS